MLLARAELALRMSQAARNEAQQRLALAALKTHTDALQTWVIERQTDALAWTLIAPCARQLGQPLRAIRAEAEARYAIGDLNGALDRFKAGQRMARTSLQPDHIEASVIDSRTRDVERQRRRVFAEIRGVREEDLPPVLPPNVPL